MKSKIGIFVLGWEDRATEGFMIDQSLFQFSKCFVYRYADYSEKTKRTLLNIEEFCNKNDIGLKVFNLHSDSILKNWLAIGESSNFIEDNQELVIDISTMPRETLWTIMFFYKQKNKVINFIYHRPIRYADDWLSREPDNPRLLFKHSGIIHFDRPTLLFVITGFDIERTRQLINYYEPKKTILLIQKGDQYNNAKRNSKEVYFKECAGLTDVEIYETDSYDLESSYNSIQSILDKYKDEYNIVASSLGPKISGVALYLYNNNNESIALTYIPCKEYNSKYSSGIRDHVVGTIKF